MGHKSTKLRQPVVEQLVAENNGVFGEREVQDWFKGFVRNCPTGHLSLEDFITVYKAFGFPGDSSKFAELVYRSFDKSEEGVISFREFLKGLAILGRGTPEAKLGWAFSVFDQDKDGLVSREEMIVVVDAVYRMVGPAVKEMSEDVNTPQKRVDKLFRQAEKGKKEKLAFQDFCSIVEQDEAIWNILRCDMTNSEMVPM